MADGRRRPPRGDRAPNSTPSLREDRPVPAARPRRAAGADRPDAHPGRAFFSLPAETKRRVRRRPSLRQRLAGPGHARRGRRGRHGRHPRPARGVPRGPGPPHRRRRLRHRLLPGQQVARRAARSAGDRAGVHRAHDPGRARGTGGPRQCAGPSRGLLHRQVATRHLDPERQLVPLPAGRRRRAGGPDAGRAAHRLRHSEPARPSAGRRRPRGVERGGGLVQAAVRGRARWWSTSGT